MGDIRSADGLIWEVKRVTCPPTSSKVQLQNYIEGYWADNAGELIAGKHPMRGDSRDISGLIEDIPGYTIYYKNVGNGFILYNYFETNNYDTSILEQLYESVTKKAELFNENSSTSNNTEVAKHAAGIALIAIILLRGGGGNVYSKLNMDDHAYGRN